MNLEVDVDPTAFIDIALIETRIALILQIGSLSMWNSGSKLNVNSSTIGV